MRTGFRRTGSFRGAEQETAVTLVLHNDWLDAIAPLIAGGYPLATILSVLNAREPFHGGENEATAQLYPALAGDAKPGMSVQATSCGHYQIELIGYGILPYWRRATWEQALNVADTLTFDYPADADHAACLRRPRMVRLYDALGQLQQVFRCIEAVPTVARESSGEAIVHVRAESLLSQLADEWVSYYGGVRRAARDILGDYNAWRAIGTPSDLEIAQRLQDAFERLASWSADYVTGDEVNAGLQSLIAGYNSGWFVYDSTTAPYAAIDDAAIALLDSLNEYVDAHTGSDTVSNHVAALLAQFQTANVKIGCGRIYDPLAGALVEVTFEARPLLDCMIELHKLAGQQGQFTVTPSRRFVWMESLGSLKPVDVKLGHNLRSLTRRNLTTDLCTRLYVYGGGFGQSHRIVAMRERNIATYGVIVRHVVVDEITDQDTLDEYADAMIEVLGEPAYEYMIDAVDLSSLGLSSPITIGAQVNVADAGLGVNTTQTAVSIRRNLDAPLDVTFTFSKSVRDLAALLRALTARIERIERRDIAAELSRLLRSGWFSGLPRLGFDDPRVGDLQVAGRLQYFDGQNWESMPRHDPQDGPQVGDTRLDENNNLQHWDGTQWLGAAIAGTQIQTLGYANQAGTSSSGYARADHVHMGVLHVMVGHSDMDYIVGWLYDPQTQTTGDLVKVLKPFHLQYTPFMGATINYDSGVETYDYPVSSQERVVTLDGVEYSQSVTPPYFTGDVLTVIAAVTPYEDVHLEDLNTSARRWVEVT